MIYFYTGKESAVRKQVESLSEKFRAHTKVHFSEDNFSEDVFAGSFLKTSLFGESFFIEIEGLLGDYNNFFEKVAPSFPEDFVFIFIEKKDKEDFLQGVSFEKKTFPDDKDEMDFSFWKAVGSRDKKATWLAFTHDKKKLAIEQIHASLFSQIKNIYKAKKWKGESSRDMDFAKESSFLAAKRSAEKYTEEELSLFLYELIKIKEESRSEEGGNLETLLEKIILKYV